MADLTEIIEDSIADSVQPDVTETSSVDAGTETVEATTEDTTTESTSEAVASPAAQQQTDPADPFAKEFGITSHTEGRENRIPYSRVKSIVENARKKAVEPLTTELGSVKEKLTQAETYLQKVGQFEDIMVNDKQKFVQMLFQIPGYAEFFQQIFSQAPPAAEAAKANPDDEMPAPDQVLSDGSKVYSMEGLKSLMAWQASQVEKKVAARYSGMETEWQDQRRIQSLMPQVHAQVTEARTWPMFTENEPEIVKVLQTDKNISLERAYQQVVYPKLLGNRDKMRQELLSEIKKAPTGATSVPGGGARRVPAQPKTGDLDAIIKAAIDQSGIR